MSKYVIVNNNNEYLCYFERHSEYKKVYYTGFGKDIRLAIKTNSFTDAEYMLKKKVEVKLYVWRNKNESI